jgi:hypothetical protein
MSTTSSLIKGLQKNADHIVCMSIRIESMEARAICFKFLRKDLYGQDLFLHLLLMFVFIRRLLCYKQLSYNINNHMK